jgi:hypothetical protein
VHPRLQDTVGDLDAFQVGIDRVENVLTTMTVADRSWASANAKRTAASLCGRPSQLTTTVCRTSTPGGGGPLSGPPPQSARRPLAWRF